MSLGFPELILLLAVVLLLFGPSKLPGLGKSLGEAIRGFKKGVNDDARDITPKEQLTENQSDSVKDKEKSKDKSNNS
ncbi:MAG: twin-arginine translocase TatA/TatE family subunit [Bdellovibrionales bacterium]|nr:twin-arginine translocase TatA/TatE family subunit [Bdellovibrionales bacterium]